MNCFFQSKGGQDLKQFPMAGGVGDGEVGDGKKVAATWWLPRPERGKGFGSWNILLPLPVAQRFQGKFRMVLLSSGRLSNLGVGYNSSVYTAFLASCSLTTSFALRV